MRRRFFWSIFGVSSVLIVLLMVLAVGAVNQVRKEATRSELERAGQAIGAVLSNRLDRPRVTRALRDGTPLVDLVGDLGPLRAVAGGSRIDIYAVGPDGVIDRPAQDVPIDVEALRGGQPQMVEVARRRAPTLFVYATPIATFPERDVVLVASVTREVPVSIRQPGGLLLVAVGAAAVMAALMAWVLSRRLTSQLRSIAVAAERVSAGDLSARAEEGGTTETDTVARSFNRMAVAMGESRERERQFLLAVGHDLRTPLTTITGYAEALEDGVDDPAELARIAAVMSAEGRRLRRLIEDVMLLARLDSADFGIRPEAVSPAAHLDEVLTPFRDRAGELRIGWEQDLSVEGERLVDPDRLAQIVGNLVENALRHTPETGTVSVSASASGDELTVRVSDTGPGVPPDEADRLFDRFYVADGHRAIRPEGSGLGLSIVKGLVGVMGGSVSVVSPERGGATFEVRLPAPRA